MDHFPSTSFQDLWLLVSGIGSATKIGWSKQPVWQLPPAVIWSSFRKPLNCRRFTTELRKPGGSPKLTFKLHRNNGKKKESPPKTWNATSCGFRWVSFVTRAFVIAVSWSLRWWNSCKIWWQCDNRRGQMTGIQIICGLSECCLFSDVFLDSGLTHAPCPCLFPYAPWKICNLHSTSV